MRDLLTAIGFVLCLFIPLMFGIFCFVLLMDKVGHNSKIEQIQMLRASYEEALVGSEVLLPKVIEANNTIINYQNGNAHWFYDVFVDDEWDHVDLIKIKKINLGAK